MKLQWDDCIINQYNYCWDPKYIINDIGECKGTKSIFEISHDSIIVIIYRST
jgi:hypothetical protein